eukprot:GHVN01044260.1.p1 GENE.GHVN01044260.1~~GHVN01044260.1.p1  ORF type:complete len:102 (-),score=7.86 GHVN01044260.1:98-403(-)
MPFFSSISLRPTNLHPCKQWWNERIEQTNNLLASFYGLHRPFSPSFCAPIAPQFLPLSIRNTLHKKPAILDRYLYPSNSPTLSPLSRFFVSVPLFLTTPMS